MDLVDVALQVVERLRPLADANAVRVDLVDMPEIILNGDTPILVQMLTNLVENAIKYSANVPEPRVEISAGWQENTLGRKPWVRVADNGIGISPEHLLHIFDRFYQVEGSRSRWANVSGDANAAGSSSTGLGLAIAQWIAHAHGGEIRVESTMGEGYTFEMVLPAGETFLDCRLQSTLVYELHISLSCLVRFIITISVVVDSLLDCIGE